jgi:retinol dehydrogenase-12
MDDLVDLRVLVTGGNTGIGLASAEQLASRGAHVYLACRSAGRATAAARAVSARSGNRHVAALPLDLGSLASVSECARAYLTLGEPLHVLINNAGVAGQRGITSDGFELAFGVNHLGHAALTLALADLLAASAPARVVTVASDAHFRASGIDFTAVRRPTASVTGMREYAVSKLCNVLFSSEIAQRMAGRGVVACSLHPGVVASDIWRRIPWPVRPLITRRMLSTQEGARTSVYCALSPDVRGGAYYDNCREREPSARATGELARLLWKHTLEWVAGRSGPAGDQPGDR